MQIEFIFLDNTVNVKQICCKKIINGNKKVYIRPLKTLIFYNHCHFGILVWRSVLYCIVYLFLLMLVTKCWGGGGAPCILTWNVSRQIAVITLYLYLCWKQALYLYYDIFHILGVGWWSISETSVNYVAFCCILPMTSPFEQQCMMQWKGDKGPGGNFAFVSFVRFNLI
jgi:hypothetical protein